jgi:hypothetical protein
MLDDTAEASRLYRIAQLTWPDGTPGRPKKNLDTQQSRLVTALGTGLPADGLHDGLPAR